MSRKYFFICATNNPPFLLYSSFCIFNESWNYDATRNITIHSMTFVITSLEANIVKTRDLLNL